MFADCLRDGFTDLGDKTGILEATNWRVTSSFYGLEFVMATKIDFPAKIFELVEETSFYETNGTFVDTGFALATAEGNCE